jgi:hypothetical protein
MTPGRSTGTDKPSGNDKPGRTTGNDKPSKWSPTGGRVTSTKTVKVMGSTGYTPRTVTMNRGMSMGRPMAMGPRPMFRTGGFSMGRRFF